MKKEVIGLVSVFLLGVFFIGVVMYGNSNGNDFRVTGYATYVGQENAIIQAPGEIIVKYKPGGKEKFLNDGLPEPISEERIVEGVELYNLKFDDSVDVLGIIEEYEDMEYVEYAEPNFIMISDKVPDDTDYSSLYWPANINAEEAWNLTVGNHEVVIAILDTGVDWNHPDLTANIINRSDGCNASIDLDGNGFGGDCRGYDFTDINVTSYVNAGYTLVAGEDYNVTDNDPVDFDGHGTHVAGIAAGMGNNNVGVLGSCYNCSIMPVRTGFNIQTSSGSFVGSLEIDDVAAALYYAADNNATIISMSFGGGDSSTVRDAIEYAYAKGSILVASSGNSGQNSRQYPCAYDEVVCVAAIGSDSSAASYSNYGSWVDLAAPGTGIYSTSFDDTYVSLSGTSMSTPMMAGVIGLVKSMFDKNQSEIVSALQNTGIAVDFSGTSINRTDVYAAILSLDEDSPEVSLISPVDGSSNLTLNQTFVCNASDWQLSSVRLDIWNSDGSLYYNSSANVDSMFVEGSFEVTLGSDIYSWNCLVEDAVGNTAYAPDNFSISTIDNIINLISPSDNSYVNSNPNLFNCSAEVQNPHDFVNMTFKLWNSSGLVHSETKDITGTVNSSSHSYNFTEEGNYHWSCVSIYSQNANNNKIFNLNTINYSITYDVTQPIINLLGPADAGNYESNNLEVNFSFSVSETSSCSLVVDNVVQETKNDILDHIFIKSFTPDDYIWRVNCTDLAGNSIDSATRSFTIESAGEESGGESSEGSGDSGDSSNSEGSGSSGSSAGGGAGATTTPVIVTPTVEQVSETIVEQVPADNFEVNSELATGITGLAIEEEGFSLSKLQKYKNWVNIFVAFLLMLTAFLFFRDYKYEKVISKEINKLEKE
jgi:subtilisin family serine protease/uncharacterized membrane protein YgcG